MQPVGQVTNEMPTQVVVNQSKSALPLVVGILFCIAEVIVLIMGALIVMGGALLGGLGAEVGDDAAKSAGMFVTAIGGIIAILGAVGVVAGVMIAQRKKLGVHLAWGLIGTTVLLNIVMGFLAETGVDYVNLGCNGICALWVGLPLLVASASQHME